MDEIFKLASEIAKEWNTEKHRRIWHLAEEFDVFVCDMEDGICIEDDVFYYEWE